MKGTEPRKRRNLEIIKAVIEGNSIKARKIYGTPEKNGCCLLFERMEDDTEYSLHSIDNELTQYKGRTYTEVEARELTERLNYFDAMFLVWVSPKKWD